MDITKEFIEVYNRMQSNLNLITTQNRTIQIQSERIDLINRRIRLLEENQCKKILSDAENVTDSSRFTAPLSTP